MNYTDTIVCHYMSCRIRKPTTSLSENKGADQLRSNCEAYQRLCFRYMDSTIPLRSLSEISSFYPSSLTVHACLCHLEDRFSHADSYIIAECHRKTMVIEGRAFQVPVLHTHNQREKSNDKSIQTVYVH